MISTQQTIITCVTASSFKNGSQSITDMLENGKVPNIVQMKKGDNHGKTEGPITFKEMAEGAIGLPYHEILLVAGKEIRDRGEYLLFDMYMRSKSTTDQNYLPRKLKIVKPAMKWSVPAISTTDKDKPQGRTTGQPKEFQFSVYPYQSKPPWDTQIGGSAFLSGNT